MSDTERERELVGLFERDTKQAEREIKFFTLSVFVEWKAEAENDRDDRLALPEKFENVDRKKSLHER